MQITTSDLKEAKNALNYPCNFERKEAGGEDRSHGFSRSCFDRIIELKRIHDISHKETLRKSLLQISKVLNLKRELDKIRKTEIKKDDGQLCKDLMFIWNHFMPNKAFQRNTNEWQKIGFQGSDPHTDLRATGGLFIENFVYFCETFPTQSRECLEIASDEQNFFFFAVTGIHATLWAIDLLEEQYHFTFLIKDCYEFEPKTVYHETFCKLLIKFTYFWSSIQRDIMDFPTVVKEFLEQIKADRGQDIHQAILKRLKVHKKLE